MTQVPPLSDAADGRDRAVLDASWAVVSALVAAGPDASLTIRDLATAAGISERTFYRYFPRKEDAVRPYLRAGLDRIVARVRATPMDVPLGEALAAAHVELLDLAVHVDVDAFLSALAATERLRAVWLELAEEAEAAFAEVVGERLGIGASSLRARLAGATLVTAARLALDEARAGRGAPSAVFAACLAWTGGALFDLPSRDGDA